MTAGNFLSVDTVHFLSPSKTRLSSLQNFTNGLGMTEENYSAKKEKELEC